MIVCTRIFSFRAHAFDQQYYQLCTGTPAGKPGMLLRSGGVSRA